MAVTLPCFILDLTRARLGRVAPLGRPKSVYKSNLEWWPIDLEGQGQWPPFSIPAESIPGCMLGANLVILAQICDESLCGQAEFPRILSQNGQNDLEGQGQWPPFSILAESIPGCMFGANLVILAQICVDKPNFLEFWVKMAKMTLKVKVNDLHFQYQLRVSQYACLEQIWWSQVKPVMSYRADKVRFTDRHWQRQYPFGAIRMIGYLGLYSLSGWMSYRQVSWSLEDARLDRHVGSAGVEVTVKFQSDWKSLNLNLLASGLHKILR